MTERNEQIAALKEVTTNRAKAQRLTALEALADAVRSMSEMPVPEVHEALEAIDRLPRHHDVAGAVRSGAAQGKLGQ